MNKAKPDDITLFISIILLCGINNFLRNILLFMLNVRNIFQNVVMDMNNVMDVNM